jgi:hypothetical protein
VCVRRVGRGGGKAEDFDIVVHIKAKFLIITIGKDGNVQTNN